MRPCGGSSAMQRHLGLGFPGFALNPASWGPYSSKARALGLYPAQKPVTEEQVSHSRPTCGGYPWPSSHVECQSTTIISHNEKAGLGIRFGKAKTFTLRPASKVVGQKGGFSNNP